MLKIRPLNRDSLSDEDAPVLRKELQEDIAMEMYNKALRLEAKEEYKDARDLLLKLVNENIPQLENQGGLPKSMATLKYSCYLNIGNIYLAEEQNVSALENYLIASELDETDVTLWYKIGKLALKENRFRQSIYAFSKGLDCNDSHWPCLDEIISLLFAVRDRIGCLYYIGKALMLDAEYTKGLVFRKQIYEDNPASKEYYFRTNADHIWEPPLDVEIDEQAKVKYLKEVQRIIDKINEAEKALESKPLSTIPLPKALENYSWLAVSKSVISLYQYIQNNEMSFFTFVDINKCMSHVHEEDIQCNPLDENISEALPVIKKTEKQEASVNEDNMDVDAVIERRPSQNSEENGTPIQTDIDEEQPIEQDTEEQDDKNGKSRTRGYKRKRDLLLDLRVWGWHSKRKNVRKTKPEKFYTVEDCLNQILPSQLLQNKVGDLFSQEDSMNTMDMYNMFVDDRPVNILSPIHSPKSLNFEHYFGTDREKEDVIKSWTRPRIYCDTCVLVKELVFGLSKLWHIKWPKELIINYITVYEMYREFYDLPNVFDPENIFEDIRDETLVTLLYAELVLFSCPKNMETGRMLNIAQIQFLETIISYWEGHWGDEYISVFSRILWLRAYIFRKERTNESAVRCLQLIQEVLTENQKESGEKYCLILPNCIKCGLISTDGTMKILKHLDMIKSISCLEELFNQEKYKEVAEIVQSTFELDSGYPTCGKIGRPAQLGMLLHSLWFTDFNKCFVWTEECLYEAHSHYTKPGPDRSRWEKMVEKCLAIMHEIIKHKSRDIVDLLPDTKKARLTETLAKIICKQINCEHSVRIPLDTVVPWILLHHLLAKYEEKQLLEKSSRDINFEARLSEDGVPASLSILFSAHEFLGPKSWCLTNQGELLHFILDVLLDKEDTYKYERLREKLDIQIEQALFCLYEHPSKKNKSSRHLADHNVDPLPLTWEKSFQLYEFYAPEVLPEFNSLKNVSITADLEQLLLRITALVIPECDPSVSIPKINEYLQGKAEEIPDPVEFPNRIRAIYYLLGDYYFKIRDFVRCVKYFLMDIAINPQRVGSWACLGLSFFSQLEIKLNFCKKIKNEDFLEKAKCAQMGFKTALQLSPDDITLWIERGTFEYIAHSFCSRYLKFESENMSMERFAYLENQKNSFLDSSGQSFEKAIALYEMNDSETDERWLQYYFLGKIAEKRHTEPNEYLNYYLTASQLLHENDATYPDKIIYNSPTHLSVEALELHYRINASILKYLELHEGKEIDNSMGNLFKRTLDALAINRKLAAEKAQKKLSKSSQPIKCQNQDNRDNTTKNKIETSENDVSTEVSVKAVIENKDKLEISNKFEDVQEPKKLEDNLEENTCKSDEAVGITADLEMEKDIKDLMENILQKVEEMEVDTCKDTPPVVEVVDEVILLDADYDIITILSSDEDDQENSLKKSSTDSCVVTTMNSETSSNQAMGIPDLPTNPEVLNQINTDDLKINDQIMEATDPVISAEAKTVVTSGDSEMQSKIAKDQVSSGVYVQQVLDKMMEETMQKASEEQIEVDSDASIVDKSIEIIECSDQNKAPHQNIEENLVQLDEINVAENKNSLHEKSDTDDYKKSTGESSSSSSSESSDSSSSSDSDSEDDSSISSSTSSSDDSSGENLSNSEILHLVDRCVKGLEQCVIRLPKNYKAIYRLVHLFFNYKHRKELNKSKQLLLGEYKCYESSTVTGLFADRKANNFFNGIWRIPSDEIDRSGSLAAHMSRCVTILLQILRKTNDCKILLELYFQLRKNPDPDKIYIKDSERRQFSDQAISLCIQSYRDSIQNNENMNTASLRKLLHDIYKAYVTIQKHVPEKESSFGQILVEVYRVFIKEKIPDNVNVLDLAIKFCQQMKLIEKQKSILSAQNLSSHNPLVPMGPVLPSPSNVNIAGSSSLKRPHGISGRPRGRPPLPKIPGQLKSPRGKSPSSAISKPSNWKKSPSEQIIAQEYIKHYQEELLKQYNQNLNYMQMAQLAQMYQNPSAFASAYLQAQQTSLLNTNILGQLSGSNMAGTMIDKNSSSQMDALQSKFNEMMALVKKAPALGNFSIDQLMASTSANSNLSSKKQNPPSSSLKNTNTTHQDQKHMQDKSKSTSELPIKTQNLLGDTTKKITKTQTKTTSQLKNTPLIAPNCSQPAQKEKNEPSSSCVSSVSLVPKEKINQSKAELKNIPQENAATSNSSVDVIKSVISKPTEVIQRPPSRPTEVLGRTILNTANILVPSPPVSSPAVFPHSAIVMPPPSPIMPPPSSPLSISSLSPSSISPGAKIPSPQKIASPVGNKEAPDTLPKLNIEAMITRVSPTPSEPHKKNYSDRLIQPANPHVSNFALEVGIPKLPSSLSMTPVNVPLKSTVEAQSITLHKVPPKATDSCISRLPSSITLTPSLPKTGSTTKHTTLDSYATKSSIDQQRGKIGAQITTSSSKKHSVSSSTITKPQYANQNFHKMSTGLDIQVNTLRQTDYLNSSTNVIPITRKPEQNPSLKVFNIESMLQPTSKPRTFPTTNTTYSYSQTPAQKVAHTSVITSTNVLSSPGHKILMDSKIPSFPRPNLLTMDGRNMSLPAHNEVTNLTLPGPTGKSKDGHRTSSGDVYKVDERHNYDTQMSNIYSSARFDKTVTISRNTKSPATSVMSSISRASPPQPQVQTSPVKTLQEKLADKKREQANKQLHQQMEKSHDVKNVEARFLNPHSISKMLSYPKKNEVKKKIQSTGTSVPHVAKSIPKKKPSSDDSIIFID